MFLSIRHKYSSLTSRWKAIYSDTDMSYWKSLKRFYLGKDETKKERYAIDDIYPEDKAKIDYLLNKYGSVSNIHRFNLYTKLSMLKRLMEQLETALVYDEAENKAKWEEQQEADMDPVDKILREDQLRAGFNTTFIKISFLEENVAEVGRYWITPKEEYLQVEEGIHHAEWISGHPEFLDEQEKNWADKAMDDLNSFTNKLFANGWVRVSDFISQMHNEYDMPNLARFLEEKATTQMDKLLTIVYSSSNEEVKTMKIRDVVDKYATHEDDELLLEASSKINIRISSREKGFDIDIEEKTIENKNYREVLFTTDDMQLVVMSLNPDEEIGMESHADGSQFFRVEKGNGKAIIGGREVKLKNGSSLIVPAGTKHNIINTGSDDLKLYTIYAPPQHKDGTIHKTKEDAEGEEE